MRRAGGIWADQRGVTVIEFAIVAPVLLLLIVGGLELGHMKYVQTIFVGQVQKAGRDMSLESSASALNQASVMANVTKYISGVAYGAKVTYSVQSFHDYRNVAKRAEEFGDANSNGVCDNSETFVDSNANGVWDSDGAVSGRGGAKDVVLLTVNLSYPRMAMGRFFGGGDTINLQSSTVLRNQPSTSQSVPATGTCK
jgi:Flp pilus assembly protein TadG